MTITAKILAGLSAIYLLLLALQTLFITMELTSFIYSGDIAAFAVIGLGILTTAACFVTSYRQILRPRPVLVWSSLGLQIVFTSLLFIFAYSWSQDDNFISFYNELRKSALAEGMQTPPGVSIDDIFPPLEDASSLSAMLLSYLIIGALMVLPILRSIIYPRLSS